MYACFRDPAYFDNARHLLLQQNLPDPAVVDHTMQCLREEALSVDPDVPEDAGPASLQSILNVLARRGYVQFRSEVAEPALALVPASQYFDVGEKPALDAALWKISRFAYLHHYQGTMQIRNPQASCYLIIHDASILKILFQLNRPCGKKALVLPKALAQQQDTIFAMLAKARVILPCDEAQLSSEESDPVLRQWDFHDLLFHTSSRLGRSDRPIGGTYRFQGVLQSQPAVKPNPWAAHAIALPVPDLQNLFLHDMPLTAAIESRRSNRSHSPIALDLEQVGHFLYRTARNRYAYDSPYGNFVSRPYPCGGANYEQEFYLTVNSCAGLKRGMYYYDPQNHALCLVSLPCAEMEAMLDEAYMACAQQCRPQILITLASRFNRFNWKYTGMSYAAQLKNIGAIYQTMYLVATSMQIAACGLGTGNADRFCQLAGLDYFQEGSIGEFMLGRAL